METYILGLLLLGSTVFVGLPHYVSSRDGMRAAIPDALLECYKQSNLRVKDLLLPMSMPVLIDLIRKVETYQGVNMDMRTLSTTLLQRFRLDGIERNPDVQPMEYVIPYSPSGSEFYRYKILMDNLIPSPNYVFPNASLTMVEQCTLHQMLSSSVDRWLRGDESTTCGQVSEYSNWNAGSRVIRAADPQRMTADPDSEVISPPGMRNDMIRRPSEGYQQIYPSGYSQSDYSTSSCPIENGVVFTQYGTVKAGVVLAGIAAGLQPQSVSSQNIVRSLRTMGQTIPPNKFNVEGSYTINNKLAATVSGEIAQIVLLQGPTYVSSMRVGVGGNWNNTLVPKYYFLREQSRDALTEADIRGSIDGLMLGSNVIEWNRFASGSLKLSQLLEMYYTEKGVFDDTFKACRRRDRFQQIGLLNTLQQESESFAQVLQYELPSAVKVDYPALQEFTRLAINKFTTAASSLQDATCDQSRQNGPRAISAVDLYIVIDCAWNYIDIAGIISYIVQQVDVNPYGSRVTIVNGKDGSILANTTQHIVDVYQNFNVTYYNMYTRGFDMARTLRELQMRFEIEMNIQRQTTNSYQNSNRYNSRESYSNFDSYSTGNSYSNGYFSQRQENVNTQNIAPTDLPKVVLFLPTASVSSGGDGDSNFIRNKIWYYKQGLPDVTLLYLTSGSKDRFSTYANNPNKDVFVLTMGSIASSVSPLIARIKEVPKPIVNPTCGSSWIGRWYSNMQTTGYLQPNSIHYYRIHPNYFYKSSNAVIRIQSQGSAPLSVCSSRWNPLPGANNTRGSGDVSCRQVSSDVFELRIPEEVCGDIYAFQCPPYYISVAVSQTQATSNNFMCRENECRYPDMVKYQISHEGLTCYSSVIRVIGSPLLIVLAILLTKTYF